jgi:hypothetical protein
MPLHSHRVIFYYALSKVGILFPFSRFRPWYRFVRICTIFSYSLSCDFGVAPVVLNAIQTSVDGLGQGRHRRFGHDLRYEENQQRQVLG